MSSRPRLLVCTVICSISLTLGGCNQVARVAASFLGKGGGQAFKQVVKEGAEQTDNVLANRGFWNSAKPSAATSATRQAASVAMSASKAGAFNALSGACISSSRVVEKVSRLNVNYNLFLPTSRVVLRIINQRIAQNNERLAEIDSQLADDSLNNREAARLQSECDKINKLNERLEAKIEFLTAQLG